MSKRGVQDQTFNGSLVERATPVAVPLSRVRQQAKAAKILVAMPVYNEAHYIPEVLPQILARAADVLVVNDGSTDGTAAALDAFDVQRITHPTNLGYGQSLIDAFAFAHEHGYEWVVTMDCDAQHDPRALARFFGACQAQAADVISGSRYLKRTARDDSAPADRQRINQLLTRLINATLGLSLTDSFCGYKAHRVGAMHDLGLTESGYAFPMQFWPRLVAAGLSVVELPVRRIYKDASRHFGNGLDNPDTRLRHYLEVFTHELERSRTIRLPTPVEPVANCCDSTACGGA